MESMKRQVFISTRFWRRLFFCALKAPLSAAITDFILVCLSSVILKQLCVTGFLVLFARFFNIYFQSLNFKVLWCLTLWSL